LNKRLIAPFACLVALAVVAAGCGGGNDETTTTASITKAQFLKQGNAICAKGNTEIEEGFESFFKKSNLKKNEEPSKAEIEEVAETVAVPGVEKQIEGLRALGAPEGEEEQVDEILTAAEEAVEKVEEDPVALLSEGNNAAFAKVNKMARAYGLTVCAEEGEEEGNQS
jgi:hypothetical protein